MTYPQPGQPGNWPDQSWPNPESYQDPAAQASPAGYAPYSAQPGYVQPPYVQPPYAAYAAPSRSTNGLAIASLVCALTGLVFCGVTSIVGAILGHVARKQIAERGEDGDGLALAGIISGWIIFGLYMIIGIAYFGLIGIMIASVDTSSTTDYGNVIGAVLG